MKNHKNIKNYLDILKDYYFKHKVIPNFDRLKEIFWIRSKWTVSNIFKIFLEEKLLKKVWNKYFPTNKFNCLELFESIKAGFPAPWTDENKTDINIQEYLINNPSTTFLLKVLWDSMINAWIIQWDIVIVDKAINPRYWDIVVWLIDWEFTLKYYQKDKNWKICLTPANPKFPTLYPTQELNIFWVVTWTVRKYL